MSRCVEGSPSCPLGHDWKAGDHRRGHGSGHGHIARHQVVLQPQCMPERHRCGAAHGGNATSRHVCASVPHMAAASLDTVPGSGHSGSACGTRPGGGGHARIPSLAREGGAPPPGSARHRGGHGRMPELIGHPHRGDRSRKVIVAFHPVLGHSVMDAHPFGNSDLAP